MGNDDMTEWTPNVSQWTIAITGSSREPGSDFCSCRSRPSALHAGAEQRADAAGVFNLSRNVGSSVGISVVSYLRSGTPGQSRDHRQPCHGRQSRVQQRYRTARVDPWTAGGRRSARSGRENAGLDHSYIDDFKLMMILSLAVLPLVLLLRSASTSGESDMRWWWNERCSQVRRC